MGNIKSYLNQNAIEIEFFPIKAENIALLIDLIDNNMVSHSLASQKLFPEMIKLPLVNPKKIAEENNWISESSSDDLSEMISKIISENPVERERLKNGEKKLTGFFIGKIMKASKGTADPKKSNQLLNKLLN